MKKNILLTVFISLILMTGCESQNPVKASFNNYANGDEASPVYTVTYIFENGKKQNHINVEANEKLKKPEDPRRQDFAFQGWYQNNRRWNFDKDLIVDNTSLSACWKYVEPEDDSKTILKMENDDHDFEISLEDNKSTKDLMTKVGKEDFSLTFQKDSEGSMEAKLPFTLKSSSSTQIACPLDVVLSDSNCILIVSEETNGNFTKLGHILNDSSVELKEKLKNQKMDLTCSID